jgi:integrase
MSHENSFTVSRFENRNGVTSWRLAGWLQGVRIRKNFKSKEEAAAEKGALELKALQSTSGLRSIITALTEDQVRDAEAAFRRIGTGSRNLTTLIDYALAHYREADKPRPMADCINTYLAAKHRDQVRDILSLRQYRSIKRELDRFVRETKQPAIGNCTTPILTAYLERGSTSLKTHNNRRGVLSTFFKFALQQEWIAANPVLKIPHHRIAHRRGSAVTITAQQSEALMRHVETFADGALIPYFALCLFAGIRPSVCDGEIARLLPESINLETGVIHIEPGVSKVRMKRHVAIQPNLAAWLQVYSPARIPIIPTNATNLRRQVFEHFGLTHDVLRHTFISMHVAKFRSMGEAALQAGNSESIIRKHYLDLKTPAEAERFFGIFPQPVFIPSTETQPVSFPKPEMIAIAS